MNPSSRNRIDELESWFLTHEDGEFSVIPSDHPSARIGDVASTRTIIYTTKPHCLSRLKNLSQFPDPIATIGRYGLPIEDDLPFVQGPSHTRIFIGDSDPPDILAFAWLREHVPIVWHGVNDDLLVLHGTRDFDWIRIPLSDAERETVPYLTQLCPDFREFLGGYCSSLLDNGFKIELEGAIIDGRIGAFP